MTTSSAPTSTRLGKYEIIAEIARGGMGIVYLARAGGTVGGFNKLVVVKELKPELAAEDSFREMFLDEARLTARLNHRNIVQTNEVGMVEGRYFIAMDYLEGRALNRVARAFEKTQPVSQNTHLRIFAEVLAGLHYAHELADFDGTSLGIIHRDICPQNVFLTFDGQVKIVDFGVAKARNRLQETEAGTLKGRVAYMSPEQLSGGSELDRRADVFAVGAMMWEVLAGQRFWGRKPELEILKSLVERKVPPLPESAASQPEELRAMVAKATDPEPSGRFATAHEFRQQIEQYLLRAGAYESLTDLGLRMMEAFKDDREKLRKVVEGHVSRSAAQVAELPKLDFSRVPNIAPSESSLPAVPSDVASQPSQPSAPSQPSTPSNPSAASQPALPSAPSQPSNPSLASAPNLSSQPSLPGASSQPNLSSGRLPDAGKSGPWVPITYPKPPSRLPWVVGVLGLVVAAGAVAYAVNAQNGPAPAASASSSAEPISTEIPSSGESWTAKIDAETIDVTITTVPANATLYLDGQPLPANPYKAKQKKGGHHTIVAKAPGYLPHTQDSLFDTNLYMTITLDEEPEGGLVVTAPGFTVRPPGPGAPGAKDASAPKAPPSASQAPSASSAPPPPPQAQPSTAPDISPSGGTRPTHPIDPGNPYAH